VREEVRQEGRFDAAIEIGGTKPKLGRGKGQQFHCERV